MKYGGQAVGVMITASHNPEEDNGVKLVDPMGDMLAATWEVYATTLANTPESALQDTLLKLVQEAKIDLSSPAKVVYGYDTRPSCPVLVAALEDGFKCFLNVQTVNATLVTTPQLHFLVRCTNDPAYGQPSESAYYAKLASAYKIVTEGRQPLSGQLTVDCANGVGGPKLKELLQILKQNNTQLNVKLLNIQVGIKGMLNNDCGADYVKTQQRAPPSSILGTSEFDRYCSLDGDADRIIFYYADVNGKFRLLDGDKIATLVAMYLIELVKTAGLSREVKVGVVQTAYANGSSTAYLEKTLGIPVTCTPTGVKYLHHAAQQYSIGVYFEANGHGTVLFSDSALDIFKTHQPTSPAQQDALRRLQAYTELINQTVGDALSDLLLVESILIQRQLTPVSWDSNYLDLPNKLAKVNVKNRALFATTDAERKLTSPTGLQQKIDEMVAKFAGGRSFVRPSGTEDCVRVYAEAQKKPEADGGLLQPPT